MIDLVLMVTIMVVILSIFLYFFFCPDIQLPISMISCHYLQWLEFPEKYCQTSYIFMDYKNLKLEILYFLVKKSRCGRLDVRVSKNALIFTTF